MLPEMISYQGFTDIAVGRCCMCVCYYSLSLKFLILCFGLLECDFNAVGYITLTKQGNKTWKYLYVQVFAVQKALETSVPTRVQDSSTLP